MAVMAEIGLTRMLHPFRKSRTNAADLGKPCGNIYLGARLGMAQRYQVAQAVAGEHQSGLGRHGQATETGLHSTTVQL